MKFGLSSIHAGEGSYPEKMIRVAELAEKAGFDSLWAGGHPFLSEKQSIFSSSLRMMDPIVALSFLAGHTRTIRLGTGIILLPQFDPLILAKQLSTLDVLSGGRLIFGVGVGWSEHEYEVLRISYHDRGKRADDYLKAIKMLWTEDHPAYQGHFVSFGSLQAFPQPVQKPHPPIVIGGNSPGAFRRAVTLGNGWFGWGLDPKEAERAVIELHKASKKYSRPSVLGDVEISVVPKGPIDRNSVEEFSKAGVNRLIAVAPWNKGSGAVEEMIQSIGDTLVGKV